MWRIDKMQVLHTQTACHWKVRDFYQIPKESTLLQDVLYNEFSSLWQAGVLTLAMKHEMDPATHKNFARPVADSLTTPNVVSFAFNPAHKRHLIYISITHDLKGFRKNPFQWRWSISLQPFYSLVHRKLNEHKKLKLKFKIMVLSEIRILPLPLQWSL